VNIQGDLENKLIAPLLFLPLVENAFKYGANELERPWISLDIKVTGSNLKFKLINGKSALVKGASFSSGIGLQNLQKRMVLVYPGKYEFRIMNEEDTFLVNLQLELETNDPA
jgi:sensor histidine kinase YesM